MVDRVGSVLTKEGYVLTTFNFRGADQSAGKTSWSGKGELGDYVSLYLFMVAFLGHPGVGDCMQAADSEDSTSTSLVLGGYSYGSMMAMHLPSLSYVQATCGQVHEPSSSETVIVSRAQELALSFLDYVRGSMSSGGVIMGGSETQPSGTRNSVGLSRRSIDLGRVRKSVDRLRHKLDPERPVLASSSGQSLVHPVEQKMNSRISVSYLLISPLLGPVAGLATMFSRLRFQPRGSRINMNDMTPDQALRSHASMIVYGSKDTFSSPKKIRKWCESLRQGLDSRLRFCEVQGAGHFWHDEDAAQELGLAIIQWLASKY